MSQLFKYLGKGLLIIWDNVSGKILEVVELLMTVKRLILGLLTLIAIARVLLSLGGSLSEPQIQGRLELYQTNLVLYASSLQLDGQNQSLQNTISSALGENPIDGAIKQYQKAREEAEIAEKTYQTQLDQISTILTKNNDKNLPLIAAKEIANNPPPQIVQFQQQIASIDRFINELDLKQGILLAEEKETSKALSTWNQLIARLNNPENQYSKTALVLVHLWEESPQLVTNGESLIKSNLDGWFRDKSLEKLYQVTDNKSSLSALQKQEQKLAQRAIIKLALISGIPVIGGLSGIILGVFLIVQLFLKKEKSILAINGNKNWETPWNWEITWQVLIVGFFFVGQIVLPFFLGFLGINILDADLRTKALYIFITYILMAAGGITVLYFSIKSFFPLPEEWFKFKLFDNWFFWGFGGYLCAIPAVVFVSLINQQIWQGQGGSNPLLSLALQAQDKVALAIFFITASIAAPVFEEIIFRGFLLPSLTRYLSVSTSIIISGFLFAIAHLSFSEILPLATLGMILGAVYTRSRNLLAPMLLHSLWNSGTLLSLFVLGSSQ